MRRQIYFPTRIGDQVIWLTNFRITLPLHATALGLSSAQLAAILLDVDNALYALESYRSALGPANTGCHQCVKDALYGDTVPGNIVWMSFSPPPGAPASVPHGCLKRVFAAITDQIKPAPGYTTMIGEALGTEGPAASAPSPTTAPGLELRTTGGGRLEVVWTKKKFDGIKLQFDLGTDGRHSDIDLRPNYILDWLPPAGHSAIIKLRARFIYKGEEFGNWSEWQTWTLTGV